MTGAKVHVHQNLSRASRSQIARFAETPTGWIADAMGRRGAIPYPIRPMGQSSRFVGSALTVQTRPVDNLAPYVALSVAEPGDVLIIATDLCLSAAVVGDLVVGMARNCGVVGVVTDGLVRDRDGLDAVGIPVFARGLTPNSPFKDGPGVVGAPVNLGDCTISSGDLVVGDIDGVVVVPHERIDATADGLARIAEKEATTEAFVAAGGKIPPWLEDVLKSGTVTGGD